MLILVTVAQLYVFLKIAITAQQKKEQIYFLQRLFFQLGSAIEVIIIIFIFNAIKEHIWHL